MAYEIFVGDLPFKGDSPVAVLLKQVNDPVPTPREGLLPPLLMPAIQKALAKDPGDRWPSAGAFVAALGKAVDVGPYEVGGPKHQTLRSKIVWAAAVGGALVAFAALA